MRPKIDNTAHVYFTAAELLTEEDLSLGISVIDAALEKCDFKLEKLTALTSTILAEEIVLAVNSDLLGCNVPEVIAQIAFEISNTIEPLLVAYLCAPELPKLAINAIEQTPDLSFLSRTGGPDFAEITVNLTKNGINHLLQQTKEPLEPNLPIATVSEGQKIYLRRRKWEKLRAIPKRLERQVIFQIGNILQDSRLRESTDKKIAVITLGLRLSEVQNMEWILRYRNKIVIDFLNFPGIPNQIMKRMPQLGDIIWAEKVISRCIVRGDIDDIQRGFFESFRAFQYLQEQILNFANETTNWQRIAEYTADKLKAQQVKVVVAGHGLLIREKLLQVAIQNRGISVISIAHSGIDDPCHYVSKYQADLYLGWGAIDEQILRDQHLDQIEYKSGVMKKVINKIQINPTFTGSKILVLLSPAQTGTTFIRVGPRQSVGALRDLFTFIEKNDTLIFGLRFHPNYQDKALTDWISQNKPENSWLVEGLLSEALKENDFTLGFSLQMPTTAIIDLANQGIPVRHVLQGFDLRDNLADYIFPVTIPNLEDMNRFLEDLASTDYSVQLDAPTMTLLSNTFSGRIDELPEIEDTVLSEKKPVTGTQNENTNLDYIFWLSSRFPRNNFRVQWVERPTYRKVIEGLLTFPKFTLARLAQAGILFCYTSYKKITRN